MPTKPMTPNYPTTLIYDYLASGSFSQTNANIVSRHLVEAETTAVSSQDIKKS